MKRIAFLFPLLFIYWIGIAQQDTTQVLQAVTMLERALVIKDSLQLEKLLHPDLAYGHSNGWVQSKSEVLKDMSTGYLVYRKIENQAMAITIKKRYATVKEKISVEGEVNGNGFKLNLFVLQGWRKTRKGWQLMMRQSTKL